MHRQHLHMFMSPLPALPAQVSQSHVHAKTELKIEKETNCRCVRLLEVLNTTWEILQIAKHKSWVRWAEQMLLTDVCFVICRCSYWVVSPPAALRTIFFSFRVQYVFGINLIPFFDGKLKPSGSHGAEVNLINILSVLQSVVGSFVAEQKERFFWHWKVWIAKSVDNVSGKKSVNFEAKG